MKVTFLVAIFFCIAFTANAGILDTINDLTDKASDHINKLTEKATDLAGSVKDKASGLAGSVVDKVTNVKDSVSNTLTIAQFGAKFLWDNAFKPSLDILKNNGTVFIDKKFGGILNAFGKRDVEAAQIYHVVYETQANNLEASFQALLQEFLSVVREIVTQNLLGVITNAESAKKLILAKVNEYVVKAKQLTNFARQNIEKSLNEVDSVVEGLQENVNKMGDAFIDQLKKLADLLTAQLN